MRKISLSIKFIAAFCAFTGVIIGFFNAEITGYGVWHKTLLYFTTQSNLWIGFTLLVLAIYLLIKKDKSEKALKVLYLLKFIFTVSITITGLIYCCLLAPFADETYRPWSIESILVHVVVPTLSVVDFFVDDYKISYGLKDRLFAYIPPLAYFVFAVVLGALGVTFRGEETYPYFFMNFNSPVGLFGFKTEGLFEMGSIYWIIVIMLLIFGLGLLYATVKNKQSKKS